MAICRCRRHPTHPDFNTEVTRERSSVLPSGQRIYYSDWQQNVKTTYLHRPWLLHHNQIIMLLLLFIKIYTHD